MPTVESQQAENAKSGVWNAFLTGTLSWEGCQCHRACGGVTSAPGLPRTNRLLLEG